MLGGSKGGRGCVAKHYTHLGCFRPLPDASRPHCRPLPHPYPTNPQASSVPIAIPALSRWPKPATGQLAASFAAAPPAAAMAVTVAMPQQRPAAAAPASWAGARQVPPAPAAAFVPPHRMTCGDDFGLTAEGGSPVACLKRERLRVRNAVLRSTGFL